MSDYGFRVEEHNPWDKISISSFKKFPPDEGVINALRRSSIWVMYPVENKGGLNYK